jgi:carbonic anhydrase/acetyltransferase-like protein (isoleucine patch superfamily)
VIHELEGRKLRTAGDDYYVAPGAQLIGDVELGAGVSIWFNAVLRADDERIVIGAGSNVQDGSVVHCDPGMPVLVGQGVTIGHCVLLHGCAVGDGSLVGNGALVLDGARIGAQCLVGAGSLVTPGKQFPDRSVIMGSPARVVREVGAKELELFAHAAANYLRRLQRYRAGLQST